MVFQSPQYMFSSAKGLWLLFLGRRALTSLWIWASYSLLILLCRQAQACHLCLYMYSGKPPIRGACDHLIRQPVSSHNVPPVGKPEAGLPTQPMPSLSHTGCGLPTCLEPTGLWMQKIRIFWPLFPSPNPNFLHLKKSLGRSRATLKIEDICHSHFGVIR